MLEHGDSLALHEPFRNLQGFGHTDVAGRTVASVPELIDAIRTEAQHRTVFFKDTTDRRHPEVLADEDLLLQIRHTFLIRRPDEIAASFYARDPQMTAEDIGLENLHEMHAEVAELGLPAVVVDSQDLVEHPEETIAAWCDGVGLPYRPEAVTWEPGERPEWEKTTGWHDEVSRTSGFTVVESEYEQTCENNEMLAEYSRLHEPFYRELHAQRLVPVQPGR